jgi:ribonuclease-3
MLYKDFPEEPEGNLAKIKAVVVSEDTLAGVARELQIDGLLVLGKGEDLSGGRQKNTILADALEALIGALYSDSGYHVASLFVRRWMQAEIERVRTGRSFHDHKSVLQELCQQRFHKLPVYHMLKKSGPDHNRVFWAEVLIAGVSYGPGLGHNKKTAEQEAARIAFEALQKSP